MEARPARPCACTRCGTLFERGPKGRTPKFCSRECHDRRRREYAKTCGECGERFTATAKSVKYCPACKAIAAAKNRGATVQRDITKLCPVCDRDFTTRTGCTERQTCSTECGSKLGGIRNSKNRVTRDCRWCQKTFTRHIAKDGKSDACVFCSRRCYFAEKAAKRRAREDGERRKPVAVWFPDCKQCGDCFCARTSGRSFCSRKCSAAFARESIRKELTCLHCGTAFQSAGTWTRYCSEKCKSTHHRQTKRKHSARAKRRRRIRCQAQFVEHVDLDVLIERDAGMCQICNTPVSGTRRSFGRGEYDPLAPSVDHVIPVSLGGEHSYANTRLAHVGCNSDRGNCIDDLVAKSRRSGYAPNVRLVWHLANRQQSL